MDDEIKEADKEYRKGLLKFLLTYRKIAFLIVIVGILVLNAKIIHFMYLLHLKDKLDGVLVGVYITSTVLETIICFKVMIERVFSPKLEKTSNDYLLSLDKKINKSM